MLQNDPHSSIGNGVRPVIGMIMPPDQSSSRDHAHAITLDEASNSTMAIQRPKSQNSEHPISLCDVSLKWKGKETKRVLNCTMI
jgi:hypothetical protein